MSLIYYLDNNNNKVANANAYAKVIDIDDLLITKPIFQLWDNLDDDVKERYIISMTKRLDSLTFIGEINETGQNLKFPRKNFYDLYDDRSVQFYGLETQKINLKYFISIQIEADLQKGSIAQYEVSQGEEDVIDMNFEFHKNAIMKVKRWLI